MAFGRVRGDRVNLEREVQWLEYGDVTAVPLELRDALALALGLEACDLHEDLPVMRVGATLICAVPNTMFLDGVEPDFERLNALRLEVAGALVFTFPGRGGCFTDSRHFAVRDDQMLEQASSPDAHAALAAYLCANQFFDDGPRSFCGAQGYRLRQRSRLEVRFNAQGDLARDVRVREVVG